MKIPENLQNTSQFNKLRRIKQDMADSIDIFKQDLQATLDKPKKAKRNLTKEEMAEINSKIINDNKNNIISCNVDLPLVSVIINYNNKEYLSNLLNMFSSIFSSYSNIEIIIINNSRDTLDWTMDYDGCPINILSDDKKRTVTLFNKASKQAKGEYLLFLEDDTIPLSGFLNHMMDAMLNNENVGVVGSRLIYPELNNKKCNSYTIEHEGYIFKEVNKTVLPFNRNEYCEYCSCCDCDREVIATSVVSLLIKKAVFESVNGFSQEYIESFEDVDLCLRLHKLGYKNYISPKSMLFHFNAYNVDLEFYDKDKQVFKKYWNTYLLNKVLLDKINAKCLFSDKPLVVAFVVTQNSIDTKAGDYFTAMTLAKSLEGIGWQVKYLSRYKAKNQANWYYVDDDVDVVFSLLDDYDVHKIHSNRKSLIKIAWLRNWFERWVETPHFDEYDIILASSKKACNYVKEDTYRNVYLFPLATDLDMFNDSVSSSDEYGCDYCFTGSYWDSKREIMDCIDENSKYKFNLYGGNWDKVKHLSKYYKGFVDYGYMPIVYASTKIVLDDANHVTKEYGSVNSRVFDAFASGKLVLTNGTMGNQELFGGMVPEYHSKEELYEKIDYYMNHPDEARVVIEEIREIIINHHTYKHRANKLKNLLKYYSTKYN